LPTGEAVKKRDYKKMTEQLYAFKTALIKEKQ
jgi:hypothetical protein